ncbi:MAG: FAD:protein FMN transferase [Bifidobacteriaceae bacterium]|nr:FAD:protein FMN transferase [Bifidobacteriaceae bacterium]
MLIAPRLPGPGRDQALGVVELTDSALATSGLDEQPGHIIDPGTGRPTAGRPEPGWLVEAFRRQADGESVRRLDGRGAILGITLVRPAVAGLEVMAAF